jgi:hypothetical protein
MHLQKQKAPFQCLPLPVLQLDNARDQSRMWEQQQAGYGHLNKLLPDVVFSWSSNFSLLLSTTAELLPEVRGLAGGQGLNVLVLMQAITAAAATAELLPEVRGLCTGQDVSGAATAAAVAVAELLPEVRAPKGDMAQRFWL